MIGSIFGIIFSILVTALTCYGLTIIYEGKDRYKSKDDNKIFEDPNYCILVLLAEMMKTDGRNMKCELDIVKSCIHKYYKTEAEQRTALKQFQIIINDQNQPDLNKVYETLKHLNYFTKSEIIKDLLTVAYADDEFQNGHPYGEEDFIHNTYLAIGIEHNEYIGIYILFMEDYKKAKEGSKKNEESAWKDYEFEYKYCVLELLAEVMKADKKQMNCEIDKVKDTIRRHFNTEDEQKEALQQFNAILEDKSHHNIKSICNKINSRFNYAAKSEIIMELLAVIYADDKAETVEMDLLQNIVNKLNLTRKEFKKIKNIFNKKHKEGKYKNSKNENHNQSNNNRSSNSNSSNNNSGNNNSRHSNPISSRERDAYEILGVDRDASDAEIKKAYRAMAIQYHPDKVYSLGDEAIRQATETMKQINRAWDIVKEVRGMK